jgi:hypothetical protein
MIPHYAPFPPKAPGLLADDLAYARRMEGQFAPYTECNYSIVPGLQEDPVVSRPDRPGLLESRRRRRARLEARR